MILPTKQKLLVARTIISIGIFLSLTSCSLFRPHLATPEDPVASVPEASARLNDLTLKKIDIALDQAVCLVRSGQAKQCQDSTSNPNWCDVRSEKQVRNELKAVFDELPKIKLANRFKVNSAIKKLIPDSIPTKAVKDARRSDSCEAWSNDDGRCVAIKFDILWILLHSPAEGDGSIDRFEIFLAEPACQVDVG